MTRYCYGLDFPLLIAKALFKAAAIGNLEEIEALLWAGANVDEPDNSGNTLLSFAATNGNADVLSLILEYAPNLTLDDTCNLRPQHLEPKPNSIESSKVVSLMKWTAPIIFQLSLLYILDRCLALALRFAKVGITTTVLGFLSGFSPFQYAFKTLPFAFWRRGLLLTISTAAEISATLALLMLGTSSEIQAVRNLCTTAMTWSFTGTVVREAISYMVGLYIVRVCNLATLKMKDATSVMTVAEPGLKALNAVLDYGGDSEDMMIALLNGKLQLNMDGVHAYRVWIWAARRGYGRVIEKLFHAGMHIDASMPETQLQDSDGGTARCWAVWGGHQKLVAFLIRHGAQIEGVPNFPSPPLLLALDRFATLCNYEPIVEMLLEAGADPMKVDSSGRSTLCYATAPWAEKILTSLLNAGVDPNLIANCGKTPLHFAGQSSGTHSIIDILVNAGSNPLIQDQNGMTPLHYAARSGSDAMIISLLRAGPSAVKQLDVDGTSALTWAIWNGYRTSAVALLIAAGSDVNISGGRRGSPLSRAALLGDPEIVRNLVRAGADPNGQCEAYDRPIFAALRRNNQKSRLDVISFLLENGVDVTLVGSQGTTFREAITRRPFNSRDCCALLELEEHARKRSIDNGSPVQ
jgi:ankyrin repeat protein